jgi:hypothetical protein
MAEEDKPYYDYLCANHVRNLPMDEFNRLFEKYLRAALGAEMETIRREGNGHTRVEASGVLLLRSLCHPFGKTNKTKGRDRELPGIAVTSPSILKFAVTKVCRVRKRRTGSVTRIMREANANVIKLANTRRKAKHKADLEQKARTQLNKGIQHNINMTEILVGSVTDLEANLEMLDHAVGASMTFLK